MHRIRAIKMRSILVAFGLLGIVIIGIVNGWAQDMPRVGQPMPGFRLDNVTHYSKTSVTQADFAGKWLFMDFWFPNCIPCIQAMPKVNAIQEQFNDDIVWMMVGLNNREYAGIETLYEKLREKRKLTMVSAYDSALAKRWAVRSMPHIIIVSPNGIVHSITSGRDLYAEKVKKLIEGMEVTFYPKGIERPDFLSPLHELNIDSDVTYSSLLTKWNGERQWGTKLEAVYGEGGYRFSMYPLHELYLFAYFGQSAWIELDTAFHGKFYPTPVLEIRDKSLFEYDFIHEVGKGTYNYCLDVPVADRKREFLMTCMQEDLQRAFKYKVSIQEREMPAWLLTGTPEAVRALKTRGGEPFITPGATPAGYTVRNKEAARLIHGISFYVTDNQPPFIDATGLEGNFDFSIEADMTSIPDIQRALRLKELNLVKGQWKFKVLVIEDP
jgi:thiol-disulfide isomerase/thioredoxin